MDATDSVSHIAVVKLDIVILSLVSYSRQGNEQCHFSTPPVAPLAQTGRFLSTTFLASSARSNIYSYTRQGTLSKTKVLVIKHHHSSSSSEIMAAPVADAVIASPEEVGYKASVLHSIEVSQ